MWKPSHKTTSSNLPIQLLWRLGTPKEVRSIFIPVSMVGWTTHPTWRQLLWLSTGTTSISKVWPTGFMKDGSRGPSVAIRPSLPTISSLASITMKSLNISLAVPMERHLLKTSSSTMMPKEAHWRQSLPTSMKTVPLRLLNLAAFGISPSSVRQEQRSLK